MNTEPVMETPVPARVVLTGRVYPERANVSISMPGWRCHFIDTGAGVSGQLTTEISLCQISAIYYAEAPVSELLPLKNAVEDAIRTQLDILGFVLGIGYDAEITQAILLDGHKQVVIGVGIEALDRYSKHDFDGIIALFSVEESDFLRRSLADLREAIKSPKDTGEFCYRAIETIRKYFVKANLLDDSKREDSNKSWKFLREELNVARERIDEISKFAVDPRHG
ncbi:MAG: hypothetical protein K2X93_26200 [Candidatus Obscuribacterales bacterium]|nr:hypothetical protein [Candidatus Obscuribacterales bacterium]